VRDIYCEWQITQKRELHILLNLRGENTMADPDMNDRVKEALSRTNVMALSTVGPDGSWTCPVGFKYTDKLELSFVSLLSTKHAKNIAIDNRVSLAIFSVPGPEGGSLGLQIKGVAVDLGDNDGKAWHHFKITPNEVWCYDSRSFEERQQVDLDTIKLDA
jgi:hypothetical protein